MSPAPVRFLLPFPQSPTLNLFPLQPPSQAPHPLHSLDNGGGGALWWRRRRGEMVAAAPSGGVGGVWRWWRGGDLPLTHPIPPRHPGSHRTRGVRARQRPAREGRRSNRSSHGSVPAGERENEGLRAQQEEPGLLIWPAQIHTPPPSATSPHQLPAPWIRRRWRAASEREQEKR
ncbi:hypothetical protein VPH35_116622 [Triticum aestivum]